MEKDKQQTQPKVLKRLAHLLGTELNDWTLKIPEQFGRGYCSGFVFNKQIRMLIFNYELREDLTIENPDMDAHAKTILFKFQHIFPESEIIPNEEQVRFSPSVLIATTRLNANALIPVHSHTATINIEVDAAYLNGLFEYADKSPVLQSLLANTQPLLFEQIIYPSLQKIVDEMVAESVDATFKLFYLRIKAEELVCRLFMELEKRDTKQLYAINGNDIKAIYEVKAQMLAHLETPPVIERLATNANMSPTKLKRLFKQVFGNSIFNYYQEFRMKEAARLLKNEKRSVADAGYQLGFTNLSHFSKVFKAHIGVNPKQYSRS